MSDRWECKATAAVIKLHSAQTTLCICFFSCFSLSPLQPPSATFCPQASPVPSIDAQILEYECFSCQAWIFMCSCQKQPRETITTGRLIHLVTWSQLAQMDSCTGASAALRGCNEFSFKNVILDIYPQARCEENKCTLNTLSTGFSMSSFFLLLT